MTIRDILFITNGTLVCGDMNTKIDNFSIDSKDIKKNNLFFGINSGNRYYLDALKNGTKAVIVDEPQIINILDGTIILVDDTVKAMELLARRKLLSSSASVIGVTGSVGKTTTKDIIYSVLNKKYKVLKTKENYNGKIGVPFTILNLKDEDILVLEMGIDNINGFDDFSKYVKLDIGVITNIGYSHMEKFSDQLNILKAKLKIINCLKKTGMLLLNNDDSVLHNVNIDNINILKYGLNDIFKVSNIKIDDNLNFKINNTSMSVPYIGTSYIYNYLVAYIIGVYYGIDKELIKEGIEKATLSSDRMNIEKYNNITFINDYYNASYESVKNALEVLANFNTRKIAILGDILELGDCTKTIHEKIGYEVIKNHIDKLITIGEHSLDIARIVKTNSNIDTYISSNIDDALPFILDLLNNNDTVLLKASNKMNFKSLSKKIKARL